jgi:hypothetical protein
MKATIPTHKTKAPSREGLAFHEILADGLVHTAHVFGIADDEKFVERVLCIAWTNAARLVQSNFRQAATLARSLHETLEVGQAESEALCQKIAEAVAVSDRVVVMTSRPGRIVADIAIDLPRPRSIRALQKDPHFHELYAQLWSHLESGWSKHEG